MNGGRMKTKKNIIGLIVALVLLGASGAIGAFTGLFEDFEEFAGFIKLDASAVLKAVIVIFFMYGLGCLIQLIISLIKVKNGRSRTILTVTSSLARYAVMIVALVWVLAIIGVNVSTIFASIGIIALIVGFGAESLVADLVTGIFILFENQFNVGDIIEVNGFRGSVESIGVRTISLRDTGGNIKVINNSDLKNVINRSNQGSVAICEVGVAYSTDLEAFEKIVGDMLAGIKEKRSDIFIGNIDYLGVEELSDSSVVLKFKADVEEKNIFSGRRVLNKEIKCAFDKAHIEIAFPQIDVHTK